MTELPLLAGRRHSAPRDTTRTYHKWTANFSFFCFSIVMHRLPTSLPPLPSPLSSAMEWVMLRGWGEGAGVGREGGQLGVERRDGEEEEVMRFDWLVLASQGLGLQATRTLTGRALF